MSEQTDSPERGRRAGVCGRPSSAPDRGDCPLAAWEPHAGTRRDTDVPRRAAAPRRGPASASRGPPHRQSPGLPPAQTETRQVQEHFKHGGAQAEQPDRPPREKGTRETLPATASAGSKTCRVYNPNSHSTSWKTKAATTRPLSTWGFVDSWTTTLQHIRVYT